MLLCALLIGVGAAVVTITLALSVPWLGLRLGAEAADNAILIEEPLGPGPAQAAGIVAGARLVQIGPDDLALAEDLPAGSSAADLPVESLDLVEEPDSLDSYADVDRFFSRQSQIVEILSGDLVRVEVTDPAAPNDRWIEVAPGQRPLATLPPAFWVQLLSGLAGFSVGAWVWSLRRTDPASRLFAISGLGLMVSALPAAIYSTRELAIDGSQFAMLSALNHGGVHIFGGALIGLFLLYPRRLVRPRTLLVLPAALGAWLWADISGILPSPTVGMYVPMLGEMVAIVILVIVQLRRLHDRPVERAALRWMGLSVLVGTGAFVGGIAVPLLVGAQPALSQGFAFAFFFIVYGGIALGISRYRLFDLGEWSFRILFYVAGALLLLLLDVALIWLLGLDRAPALGASLLIVAFLYLPLRDSFHRRIIGGRRLEEAELFSVAMDVAFALTAAERSNRWLDLLNGLYNPLDIAALEAAPPTIEAGKDATELYLPAIAGSPPLLLRYPRAGRDLFSSSDVRLARQLVALVARGETSRSAYDRGVVEERHRIARDLHDDVGGRLLTSMPRVDGKARRVLQAALSDIRSIVSGLTGAETTLDQVLAAARHEAASRLELARIALEWPLIEARGPSVSLDFRQNKALLSTVREAITNIIRHARAGVVRVQIVVETERVSLVVTDDGCGIAPDDVEGFGLHNMRQRIDAAGGCYLLTTGPRGTSVSIEVPVRNGKLQKLATTTSDL